MNAIRTDFSTISTWIARGSRVLDLGCGDGALLAHLQEENGVQAYGVEIDIEKVIASIGNGVNVIQSDLESGLSGFTNDSFDYVILSQTLQTTRHTEEIVQEMLRVGREAIVTFPNFGYWAHRVQIAVRGRMPVSAELPYQWYNTPNVHLCTVRDFDLFCTRSGLEVLDRLVLRGGRRVNLWPNWFGQLAIFRFRRRG